MSGERKVKYDSDWFDFEKCWLTNIWQFITIYWSVTHVRWLYPLGKSRKWRYWRQHSGQRPTSAQLKTVFPKLILILLILHIVLIILNALIILNLLTSDHIDHIDCINDQGKHHDDCENIFFSSSYLIILMVIIIKIINYDYCKKTPGFHHDYINDDHHQDYNACKKMHLVFILACRSSLDIGVKVGIVVLTWDRERKMFLLFDKIMILLTP